MLRSAPLWSLAYREKLIHPSDLVYRMPQLRSLHRTIATLNGSFDLLHAGHLQIIFEASTVGDILIVALNSDDSIRKYKSPQRPIIPLEFRLQMIAALEFVDYVTWFDETDPRQLLNVIKPDIHVNGSEYGEKCIESETVLAHGGRIHMVPIVPNLSTSTIIRKIQEA